MDEPNLNAFRISKFLVRTRYFFGMFNGDEIKSEACILYLGYMTAKLLTKATK